MMDFVRCRCGHRLHRHYHYWRGSDSACDECDCEKWDPAVEYPPDEQPDDATTPTPAPGESE